jgi:hypothetical protein
MHIVNSERTDSLFLSQWEKIQSTPSDEVIFHHGSQRFGLRRIIGEDSGDFLEIVTGRIALFQPRAELGVYAPEESCIQLLEDELSVRNLVINFWGDISADDAQLRLNLENEPLMITSESLTRPEYEGRGYATALFDLSQIELFRLISQYEQFLDGKQVIAQVVDGAKYQTTGKEKSGWTSRRALAHGYTRRPEYPKRPVWHKDVTP